MLNVTIEEQEKIALLEPEGRLRSADFASATSTIDSYLEKTGQLHGIIIHTQAFPGWASFGAFVSHLKFLKHHHRKVERIALVTDSALGSIAEKLVARFMAAEIRHFPYPELEKARRWISGRPA